MRCSTLVLWVVLASCRRDCPPTDDRAAPPAAARPAANPVQHEMQLLQAAMQTALGAIAAGDVRGVPAAFEPIDRAKQATEAALTSGQYVLGRNPNQLARFGELDEAFHADLEKMLAAATRGDVAATADGFGTLVRECQPCHADFRK